MSIENPTSPRINELRIGLLSEKKNPTQEELASLKEEIIKETNAKKRFELQKKLVRLERFDSLSEGKGLTDPKQKEAAEKVLKWKNFESVRNSDLLTLKKRGIDIASLVLVDTVSPERDITSSTLKTWDSFKVNFWKNINLDKRTGAGDILPTNIRTIKINGIECERRNVPRPGYYNDSMKPAYQDIHDGDSIEILTLGNETSEDVIANEKQWKKERMRDMRKNNEGKTLTDLEEDKTIDREYIKYEDERKARKAKFEKYSPENKEKFMAMFGDIVKRETEKYGIPDYILVDNLFAHENRTFNPNIKNPYSSAHGLGQIIDDTWGDIETNILWEDLDRDNPEDQIRATCAYLNYIKWYKNCSWWDAVVYYHTWPDFGDKNVEKAMKVNAPIVKHMANIDNPTAQDYINGAKKYYGISEVA